MTDISSFWADTSHFLSQKSLQSLPAYYPSRYSCYLHRFRLAAWAARPPPPPPPPLNLITASGVYVKTPMNPPLKWKYICNLCLFLFLVPFRNPNLSFLLSISLCYNLCFVLCFWSMGLGVERVLRVRELCCTGWCYDACYKVSFVSFI